MHAVITLALFVAFTALAVLYVQRRDRFWTVACTLLAILQVLGFWQFDLL